MYRRKEMSIIIMSRTHDTVVMKGGRRSVRHIILADRETQISSAGS